ncbi:MAG: glycosyltransferase family 8 protein [Puniceicoccales bacterium]|jgi:lipopolysaccharide biosynthesis glycosyltransferase|nr:glycosyltransferase family 8 protein [Puniceicoccales bacterium]
MGKFFTNLRVFAGIVILLLLSQQALLAEPDDGEVETESAVESLTVGCAKIIVPVVLSADNNYAPQMYVTMLSMLKNANRATCYYFHLLIPSNFEQRYKDEIVIFVNKYDCKITFIDMGAKLLGVTIPGNFPLAASYRLMAPDLLPNFDKCLYMDVDVIVYHDLADLYNNTDLGDCYIAGIKDATPLSDERSIRYVASVLNIDTDQYVNSGVLLMNLDLMRKDELSKKLIAVAKHGIDGTKPFLFPDQDALNKVCCGRIKFLDIKYNVRQDFFIKVKKIQKAREDFENYFGKEQLNEAYTNPFVFHFVCPVKPWASQFLLHEYACEWWKWLKETPFYDEVLRKVNSKPNLIPTPIIAKPSKVEEIHISEIWKN